MSERKGLRIVRKARDKTRDRNEKEGKDNGAN
jgi:hypothetical protein